MKYLSRDGVLHIHNVLVLLFQDEGDPISPSGVRDEGLIESAVNRPMTSLGKFEKYRTVSAKAAALFHSLVQNHPFHNGNKRTALVAMIRFLDLNDSRVTATDKELFEFVTSVARGTLPGDERRPPTEELVNGIEAWLAVRVSKVFHADSEVRVKDFLSKIEQAGGRVKESADRRAWIVFGPLEKGKHVRIAKKTTRLSGMVARVYAGRIGFTDGKSGISFDDVAAGVQPEQRIIGDLIEVLRWLAHA